VLYYPRTKPEGGGPGLKGIKRDTDMSPCYYKVNRKLTERSQRQFEFSKSRNQNYIERYVRSHTFVPGVGKYKDVDKGLKLQTRPLSSCPRRRVT